MGLSSYRYIFLFSVNLTLSCLYTSEIPLENSIPECNSHSHIEKVLYYPDSTICTLSISDLNDYRLSLSTLSCEDSSPGNCSLTSGEKPWPGTYTLLNENYGTKRIELKLDTTLLGVYKGLFVVHDFNGAQTTIPYQIHKLFYDPFDYHLQNSPYWNTYREHDTSTVKIDYTDKKLLFSFDIADSTQPLSTGLASNFTLTGDFHITVDFKLRDEMVDGFEVGFFVSTSRDTGKWSGDISGIFLHGKQERIRLECKSVDLQSFSREAALFAGELGIRREGSGIDFYYYDGNPLVKPHPLTHLTFPAENAVFIHIKMSVNDRNRFRHSLWNDFYILNGNIVQ